MASSDETIGIVLFVISVLALVSNCASVVCKVCKEYINPKLWKYSLLYQNVAHCWTSIGLLLFCAQTFVENETVCKVTGVFIIYGLTESTLSFLNTGVILLSIQNPGKSDSISNYHRNIYLVVIIPEVVFGAVLSFLPYVSERVVDSSVAFDVRCLPVVDHGKSGWAYGTVIVSLWWILLVITIVSDIIVILKSWKFNNRIDLSPNNVWQTQLIAHGKTLITLGTIEHGVYSCVILLTTISIYSEASLLAKHKTWIVMTSVAIATLLHGVLSNVSDVMWSTCCCRAKNSVQEPHRKLKKLELVKIEASGKLRMKAIWSVGKHANKRGLMKVYGVNHLKSWAQEIVMLGMMRKAQHPSLIQCLWTNSSNPYYETMTLISGEIVTSDSRIICLELTNGGTLQDFLQKADLPLPEPCQRMIIHDIAEGLFYLHHENILHNNLTSSCIYLKGSLQSMVLRAAIGDFEDAELYGTLQQSLDDSLRDKRYFFFPDIRSFALVALEIVSKMCVKKFQNRFVNYNSEQVPMKLNLENMISDEEDEFEAQYCYDIEETHRMFESVHPDDDECDEHGFHSEYHNRVGKGSLDNLVDKERPLSPQYRGMSMHEAGLSDEPYCLQISDDEDDKELALYNAKSESVAKQKHSPPERPSSEIPTCKSPVSRSVKANNRKSRRDISNSNDRTFSPTRAKFPASRSLSPKSFEQRCTSPDPMKDEKLLELRKETKAGKQSKKERKFSFNRKRSDENLTSSQRNGQAFEAFVSNGDDKSSKKKDSNWLSKPTSILKNIAGNESSVSVFKAKSVDDDNYLDAIEEEDIDAKQTSARKIKTAKTKEKKDKGKSEVWDIIDEQFYTQVNKKAMHKLKKTISGESRSSLWSFISTPEDLDDDDLDDILDSLPGMTDNFELRKGNITVNDILAERENATKRGEEKKKFSYKDLSKSRFELIDYYELLKSKRITIEDVPEEKRDILLNVVELKLEERLRKKGKLPNKMTLVSEDGAIRSDELYDNGMNPGGTGLASANSSGNKVRMVSFRHNQGHLSPNRPPVQPEKDPRQDRVRSAPLKRTRTPLQKPKPGVIDKPEEPSPAFGESKSTNSGVVKRSRARTALKRALNNKGSQNMFRNDREITPTREKQDLTMKYATVRKINVNSVSDDGREVEHENNSEIITVPVPTSESFSATKLKPVPKPVDIHVKRYPSFSSNESGSSFAPSIRGPKPADVSLTSGELSSLSSQAESDHYETDGHMTDIEGPSKSSYAMQLVRKGRGPPSRVDSGIESGSVSSEISDAMFNRGKVNSKSQNTPNGVINSWARNYKMVESIPTSPYNFSNKFLPPVYSLPEETVSGDGLMLSKGADTHSSDNLSNDRDTDSAVSVSTSNVSSNRMIEVSESKNRGTLNLLKRTKSPEQLSAQNSDSSSRTKRGLTSKNRPMSPLSNPVRPSDRPMSPLSRPLSSKSRPMSPNGRPMSPLSRPMSPNSNSKSHRSKTLSPSRRPMSPPSKSVNKGLSSNTRQFSSSFRPMSPSTRPMSPSNSSNQRPMSPKARPMSPKSYTSTTGGCARPDVSPSRALSPIERVDSQTVRSKHQPSSKTAENNADTCSAPIITVESSDANGGQEKSNQASRRYRELVKQGVPLRASVIESSPTRTVEREGTANRPGTAESTLEETIDDQQLFEDLESKGFFATHSRSPNRRGTSPNRSASPKARQTDSNNNKSSAYKRKRRKEIPLEEIVRENPSSGPKPAHRSPSKNHLIVSEDAFLNQPTSEDSETCSIKTNKSTNSSPSGSKPKVMVDAELVIDRIFSQNNAQDYDLDVEVEAALGLDKNPLKQLKHMYKTSDSRQHDVPNLDNIPLLNGVSQKHIHECLELASSLHVITVRDLLPATKDGYEVLRNKLMQIGQLGSVGVQLLDIIEKCWLLDMPPTSGILVEQLTDPVTETEL